MNFPSKTIICISLTENICRIEMSKKRFFRQRAQFFPFCRKRLPAISQKRYTQNYRIRQFLKKVPSRTHQPVALSEHFTFQAFIIHKNFPSKSPIFPYLTENPSSRTHVPRRLEPICIKICIYFKISSQKYS